MNNVEQLLENLGLEQKEAKVYLSLIELGPQLPQHIARNTGLKRTTLYQIFPEMVQAGLISEIKQGRRRLFQAVSPDKLFDDYSRRYKKIKENFAELASIYRLQGLKPKLEVYEGIEGLKKVYLKTLERRSLIRNFVQTSKLNPRILEWLFKEYVPLRVQRGVNIKALVPNEQESSEYLPSGKKFLRTTRVVPEKKFPFRIEGMIQENKVFFIAFEKGGPLVGIIIESKQIADTLAALFDLAWVGAKRYSN